MKVLITSGGTQTPIDDVRFITNFSQGTLANELADIFMKYDTQVHFHYAKHTKAPHLCTIDLTDPFAGTKLPIYKFENLNKYSYSTYKTFDEYKETTLELAKCNYDLIICAAAVSDYAPIKIDGKISSDLDEYDIRLKRLPKVINLIKAIAPNSCLVGFKLLETLDNFIPYAKKQHDNGVDVTIGNALKDLKDHNRSLVIYDQGVTLYTKNLEDVVKYLIERKI